MVVGSVSVKAVLDELNEIKPNTLNEALALKYLSKFDMQLWQELLSWHNNVDDYYDHLFSVDAEGKATSKLPYTDAADTLLVPYEYAQLYVDYLIMQIDLINNDTQRYNNSAINFNASLMSFASYINREYMPVCGLRVGIGSAMGSDNRAIVEKGRIIDRQFKELESILAEI